MILLTNKQWIQNNPQHEKRGFPKIETNVRLSYLNETKWFDTTNQYTKNGKHLIAYFLLLNRSWFGSRLIYNKEKEKLNWFNHN